MRAVSLAGTGCASRKCVAHGLGGGRPSRAEVLCGRRVRRGTGLVMAGAGAAVLVWGEWLNWRWPRALVGTSGAEGGAEAVVVLGYRNPQASANLINRRRVRAGIRSVAAGRASATRVIFSGGAVGGESPEARLMAGYAKSVLRFDGTVLLEELSETTWENITQVIPLLEDAARIRIVSQPAHALKARAYLRRQRPDLAERLVRASDYRPGEWLVAKPLPALCGLWALRRLPAGERKPSPRTARQRHKWCFPNRGRWTTPHPGARRTPSPLVRLTAAGTRAPAGP